MNAGLIIKLSFVVIQVKRTWCDCHTRYFFSLLHVVLGNMSWSKHINIRVIFLAICLEKGVRTPLVNQTQDRSFCILLFYHWAARSDWEGLLNVFIKLSRDLLKCSCLCEYSAESFTNILDFYQYFYFFSLHFAQYNTFNFDGSSYETLECWLDSSFQECKLEYLCIRWKYNIEKKYTNIYKSKYFVNSAGYFICINWLQL